MAEPGELFILAVLGLWFILSVLNQIARGRFIRRIKLRDKLGLIPIWTFFAPNPGRSDYHVLYRDETTDGSITPWKEIRLRRSGWTRPFWHPDKRISKAVSDIMAHFLRPMLRANKVDKSRFIEVPYILLLNYISLQPRDFQTRRRQFAIAQVERRAVSTAKILFVSARHALDPVDEPATARPGGSEPWT